MSVEIKVPVLPESVPDATMLQWHKKVGDSVRRDENIVDIETDKVVLEVPAPTDGVITAIMKTEGETVVSNDLIATLEPGAVAATDTPGAAATPAAPASAAASAPAGPLSPAVRRMVEEHGLDPASITGTGRDGRLLKEDVQAHLDAGGGAKAAPAPATPAPAAAPPAPAPLAPMPAATGERNERREPMSRLRQTIARRLVESQQTAALLTTFNEVDMSAVMDLRKKYKEAFEKQHDVKLGFMSFFVKAAVDALNKFPAVNAYVEDTEIVYHDFCDVGIAVSSNRGLVVPILRDAQMKSFARIEQEINDYGARAQAGDLSMDELTGGTFTISNGGIFGSMLSTPIVNPPQSAILGMHNIQQRPVAIDGEVVIRPMMYLALSYDHRIVDGRGAVQFLVSIKNALEDPARLMLEI